MMMDIADIRKKAKTKAKKPEQPATSQVEEAAAAAEAADDEAISVAAQKGGLIIDDAEDDGGLIIDDAEDDGGLIIDDAEDDDGLVIDDAPEADQTAEPVVQEPAPPAPAEETGLDRLFSSRTAEMFATEESYEQVLSTGISETRTDVQQYLAFNLGAEEYALDITQISEIIKVREFTDIPRVPDFILGIISLRGVVVPIFDLKKRFRLGETTVTAASRIIVSHEDDLQAGLLVDCINQVIHLNEDQIEPPPAILSGIDRDLVEGVGRYQGRMIILLNLKSVLNIELK